MSTMQMGMFAREDRMQAISPAWEISAYEALWTRLGTVKRMAELFRKYDHALPSYVAHAEGVPDEEFESVRDRLRELHPFHHYSALFFGDYEFPKRLGDAKHPIEVLYYSGALDLLSSRSVAVVGSRKPSAEGIQRTKQISRLLVESGFTVMSGLAAGIDATAHHAALEAGGRTIAVLGTPLHEHYPKENRALQDTIASEHLLVSQVPFYFASTRDWRANRSFFPERNRTMSALSLATIIVEASDTSGTLFQARAAVEQGRKLFILNSCFEAGLEWPEKYLEKGAVRVVGGPEIIEALEGL